MATFYDNFDRANGAPGGNWVNVVSSATISGGYLTGSGSTYCYNTTVDESLRHHAIGHFGNNGSTAAAAGVIVKMSQSSANGYLAYIGYSAPNYYFLIRRGTLQSGSDIASAALGTSIPSYYKIEIVYDDGVMTATLDNSTTITANDLTYAGGVYMGIEMPGNTARVADFTAIGGSTPTFDVSPETIGNYGDTTDLTLTGGNTAWSAGTPGTPTFTCNHGTITSQSVSSSTAASCTYDPGNYLGTVTFTDPSTGATATIVVSSDPGTVTPPSVTGLTEYAIAMLNNTAGESLVEYLTKPNTPVEVDAESTIELVTVLGRIGLTTGAKVTPTGVPDAGLLSTLWILLNGRYDPVEGPFGTPAFTTTDAGLAAIKDDLDALMGLSEWTLPDLLTTLGGDPLASHSDIMTAIAGIGTGSNQDVLDQLAIYFGANPPTIEQLGTMVSNLATVAGYDLGDILDAIATIPTNPVTSLTPVLDKLDLIQPSSSYTLSSLASQSTTIAGTTSAVDASLTALRTAEALTLGDVMLAINALADLISALNTSRGAPVWPGADGVTLGTPVALSAQLSIETAMDGCIIAITGVDPGTAKYTYGGVPAYRNVGALCFMTDQGDLEEWQLLGREAAIYTPNRMARAGGLRLFSSHGLTGTVTPWSIT